MVDDYGFGMLGLLKDEDDVGLSANLGFVKAFEPWLEFNGPYIDFLTLLSSLDLLSERLRLYCCEGVAFFLRGGRAAALCSLASARPSDACFGSLAGILKHGLYIFLDVLITVVFFSFLSISTCLYYFSTRRLLPALLLFVR